MSDDKTELKEVYGDDGVTLESILDKDMNFFVYQDDGVTPLAFHDKNGGVTYFKSDGVTFDAFEDADGNKVFFQEDGVTISSISDAEEKYATFYQNDGKTVDKTVNIWYDITAQYDKDGKNIVSVTDVNDEKLSSEEYSKESREIVQQSQEIMATYNEHKKMLLSFKERVATHTSMKVQEQVSKASSSRSGNSEAQQRFDGKVDEAEAKKAEAPAKTATKSSAGKQTNTR